MSRASAIKKRQALIDEKDAKYANVLVSSKKELALQRQNKKQKKKSADELLCETHCEKYEGSFIRSLNDFSPRSYNRDRQIENLIRHLLVKYPVPSFMYESMIRSNKPGRCYIAPQDRRNPNENKDCPYRDWFIALSQGKSFPKLAKDYMTRAECAKFLIAPSHQAIDVNVWWAKLEVAGVPNQIKEILIDKFFNRRCPIAEARGRLIDVIRFFGVYHAEMDKNTLIEVVDFLSWKMGNDPNFSMKGRTGSSIIKLSTEWHILMQKAKMGRYVEWEGLKIPKWKHTDDNYVWEMIELLNNRDVINEGKKQRHCVSSYVTSCVDERVSIFSLRCFSECAGGDSSTGIEKDRLTIEVNRQRKSVVQIAGKMNRRATIREKNIVGKWALAHGLSIAGYC